MFEQPSVLIEFRKIQRFVISGGIGAATHFSVLIFLTEYVGMDLLPATTTAFIFASVLSFLLQKIWTFGDRDFSIASYQVFQYIVVAIINVGVNALFMYCLSTGLGLYYLIAQLITSGLIAIESYFLYKYFVFHPKK